VKDGTPGTFGEHQGRPSRASMIGIEDPVVIEKILTHLDQQDTSA